MILRHVRDYLRDDAEIRDRVDGGTNYPGIYADSVPQGHQGECIVLQSVYVQHYYHLGGEAGVRESQVQVTCYSDNAARAESLSELVRDRLSGYRGSMGDQSPTTIKTCIITNDIGGSKESPADDSDKFIHAYTTEYKIIHTTTVPSLA